MIVQVLYPSFTYKIIIIVIGRIDPLAAQDAEASVGCELVDDECQEPDSIKGVLVAQVLDTSCTV